MIRQSSFKARTSLEDLERLADAQICIEVEIMIGDDLESIEFGETKRASSTHLKC